MLLYTDPQSLCALLHGSLCRIPLCSLVHRSLCMLIPICSLVHNHRSLSALVYTNPSVLLYRIPTCMCSLVHGSSCMDPLVHESLCSMYRDPYVLSCTQILVYTDPYNALLYTDPLGSSCTRIPLLYVQGSLCALLYTDPCVH